MGCPGDTRAVFTGAFRANKRTSMYFSREASKITSNPKPSIGITIFFPHYNLFLGKLKEKLARKVRVNTERVYRIVLIPPWASHNTP